MVEASKIIALISWPQDILLRATQFDPFSIPSAKSAHGSLTRYVQHRLEDYHCTIEAVCPSCQHVSDVYRIGESQRGMEGWQVLRWHRIRMQRSMRSSISSNIDSGIDGSNFARSLVQEDNGIGNETQGRGSEWCC